MQLHKAQYKPNTNTYNIFDLDLFFLNVSQVSIVDPFTMEVTILLLQF